MVSECNCSVCSKTGFLHLIVPKSSFRLLQGAEVLAEYTFNTGTAKHLFCKVCGIKSFYVPRSHPDGYSVNARCLDPGTVTRMQVRPFDGQNWEKFYKGDNVIKLSMAVVAAGLALSLGLSGPAWAQRKDCNELKTEIEAKIRNNGVPVFTLEIVDMGAQVMEGAKVVGTCDGQTKKIVYQRG